MNFESLVSHIDTVQHALQAQAGRFEVAVNRHGSLEKLLT